ncbi:hypothetical protein CEXT_258231 [Caerostris extrusa]|uniref:Uncharacterized protein n=1 Tax=Caerostris extrusa TaxID=172846 RepID=A0AAV4P791_CAEEX|nr:hypothetical protein CEXT_258231 [Caerostris extrusa]
MVPLRGAEVAESSPSPLPRATMPLSPVRRLEDTLRRGSTTPFGRRPLPGSVFLARMRDQRTGKVSILLPHTFLDGFRSGSSFRERPEPSQMQIEIGNLMMTY